jgi:crotonobetainyl-CoA:carnitine CoA-transferase CaiB-like acyl-CoA transferase
MKNALEGLGGVELASYVTGPCAGIMVAGLGFEDILQQSKEKIFMNREVALRLTLVSFG